LFLRGIHPEEREEFPYGMIAALQKGRDNVFRYSVIE